MLDTERSIDETLAAYYTGDISVAEALKVFQKRQTRIDVLRCDGEVCSIGSVAMSPEGQSGDSVDQNADSGQLPQ